MYNQDDNRFAITDQDDLDEILLEPAWPEDVKLFQPYETEQILLPDSANCLAVQAYLKMCSLRFTIQYKTNAEEMSPSGKVPFIKCGKYLVAELEPITNYINGKGYGLTPHLNDLKKADMRAFMALVNNVLGNAENYITWCDNDTYTKITKPRYGSVHPFPLNHVLCYLKRRSAIKRLAAFGWAEKSLEKVYEEVDRGCQALSERLSVGKFFFSDRPCEVDALIFAHVYSILTWPSLSAGLKLAEIVRKYDHLKNHCRSLMVLLDLKDDIDCPSYHKLYLKEILHEKKSKADLKKRSEFFSNESEMDLSNVESVGGKSIFENPHMIDHEVQIYENLSNRLKVVKGKVLRILESGDSHNIRSLPSIKPNITKLVESSEINPESFQ